ncbi:RNA polymerase sigma factor [Arcticibacter sp.]|uniref:RNA polymerase sigma factor n=1 Tax=Arcticibacter sp. TaxID=1872630 RepID=UPI00388D9642
MQKDVFSSLIAKQSRYLKPHAMKYTGDENDAKDLIQDTLLRALLNYDKFREDTNVRGWLFIIMRNLFINKYRKNRIKTTSLDTDEAIQLPSYSTADSHLNITQIYAIIDDLPHQHRKPLLMHMEGFKYEEINRKLYSPIGTVKNRIHLARRRLKETLI